MGSLVRAGHATDAVICVRSSVWNAFRKWWIFHEYKVTYFMKLHSHVYWVCEIAKYTSENYVRLRVSGLFRSANHCRSRLCL